MDALPVEKCSWELCYICSKYGSSADDTIQDSTSLFGTYSPLELAFEKESGVTGALGLVPSLAKLCRVEPTDRKITFQLSHIGVDHFSKSLIGESKENALEPKSSKPTKPIAITLLESSSTTPHSSYSTLLSPASHIAIVGSPMMPRVSDIIDDYVPMDPHHYILGSDDENLENVGSEFTRSEIVMDEAEDSDDDHLMMTSSESSSEYLFSGSNSFDMTDCTTYLSQIAQSEEYTRVEARGPNSATTHIYRDTVMEPPRRRIVGGLSAIFGDTASPAAPNKLAEKLPTDDMFKNCHLFEKPFLEGNKLIDIYIFKGEYAYCSDQCRSVDVEIEDKRDEAEKKAIKIADMKLKLTLANRQWSSR